MDSHSAQLLGQNHPRSALNELWEAPTSWESVSFDSDDRRSRAIKKVALALFLFLAGFSMLAGGLYIWYTQPGQGRATSLLVLGSICFLPGAYHTRVAYLAWRGVEGYSLNSIPDL
ncbi:hypothetical protein Rsub_08252 [Raphidocelis subcapitata]|uniref:Transmembrane protein 230 n=1 Tax=Raphidocelis subcapitata TaxID=307507 RepID=A0A2V0P7J8_9CHLO|nr:hypothetical protein Rsub_08252 [Raphidocelis subcapitata]|eukprot:GBF95816.1 hypothetical protein Rsub_08252 [Raphidocelis subcapitata]